MGNYIVDFVCIEARLIVELDGGQHAEQVDYDRRRTAWLAAAGYRVLRFWNNEMPENPESVLECLRIALSPHPIPLPAGARDGVRGRFTRTTRLPTAH